MKKMCILKVAPEVLRDLLQLPPEATLIKVESPYCMLGVVHLVVEGIGWDTPEGGAILIAPSAVISDVRDENGTITSRTIDWGVGEGLGATGLDSPEVGNVS